MNITRGNVTVKLYETPVKVGEKRYPSWTVAWIGPEGRERKRFKDGAVAEKFANDKAAALDKGYVGAMTAEEVASYRRAHDALLPTGKSMELVANEYADVWKLTGGVSIRAMGEFWAKHHLGDATVVPRRAVDELLAAKRQDGLSPEYIHDLDVRLGKFAESFPSMPLVDLTAPVLEAWLRALPGSVRSRRNYRRALATLFWFCKEKRYLSKEWDELPKVGKQMANDAPVEIYTPEELRRLLAAAKWPKGIKYPLLPLLVLGAFAGIRTKEIQRLDWSDVGKDYITVTAKRTRSASRRIVPVLLVLREWLKGHPESGPVCRYKTLQNALAKLAKRAGVPWKHNALRHSFISYRVAQILESVSGPAQVKDVGEVAFTCGNSPQMIFQHYLERVTPQKSREWFAVCPKSVTKEILEVKQTRINKGRKGGRSGGI